MSIPITITKEEFKQIKKQLKRDIDIICLEKNTFIKFNLVGLQIPHLIKAKIIKSFK